MKRNIIVAIVLAALLLVSVAIAGGKLGSGRCHRAAGTNSDGWISHKDSIHSDSNWTYDTCEVVAVLSEIYNCYKFRWRISDTTTTFSVRMIYDSAKVMIHLQSSFDNVTWNHVVTDSVDTCNVLRERVFYDKPAGNNANDTLISGLWRTIVVVKTYDVDATATPIYDSVKVDTWITASIK